MKPGPNSGYSQSAYIKDKLYAKEPTHYVRPYLIIQKDLEDIFEYIEPSQESLSSYSYRIYELLMRTCIEIEANFKAILSENIFSPQLNSFNKPILNMNIYKKINITHRLSSYEVILPIWNGTRRVIKPFESWKSGISPGWYSAYNASKHDRQDEFKKANMENMIDAIAGLLVLLSSQFYTCEFSAGAVGLTVSGYDYHEMIEAIGSLFRIKFPSDWTDDEMYDFDWSNLAGQPDRFGKIDYNKI